METTEEVMEELAAVGAVYGDACRVIREFPPHLELHIKPRTADDASQQFVEVVLGIEATAQYPRDPPSINIVDSKGLDENRRRRLITRVVAKSLELSSCSMLVALCEEAVEIVSNMNFPEGSCPLCLYPLFSEDDQKFQLPFMKLMSCYHCFHSGCISRWWKWLQEQNTSTEGIVDQQLVNCPICRKEFDSKDFHHIASLMDTNSTTSSHEELDSVEAKEILDSDSEKSRRKKIEDLIEMQNKISGLIVSKKTVTLSPGAEPFLPSSQFPSSRDNSFLASEHTLEPTTEFPSGTNIGMHVHSNYRRNRHQNPRRDRITASKIWVPKKAAP